ncbi:MAG TPA: hypothetical protein VKC54_03590 [Patescibacteria group bacterium]|nr:hypothetical protein [Patescibacteria group bacterium]
MRSFVHDLPHYILLLTILFVGFIGLILFSYDKNLQVAISIATGISYVSWGVIHHHIHRDLHFEVFMEYLAVAVLGTVILFSLILR